MPPKSNTVETSTDEKTLEVLRALAEQEAPGPYSARAESAIDVETSNVLDALGEEYGGRSKALRYLLKRGAQAVLADRLARA